MRRGSIGFLGWLLAGCATTVPLGDLLQEGLDHPRSREHSHTGDEIRVSGVVLAFEHETVDRGHSIDATTVYRGNESFGVARTSGSIKREVEEFVVVDIRPDPASAPGYAQCRFRAESFDPELAIGKPFSFMGEFKGYRRTPQGLRAEFAFCIPD